MPPTPHTYVTHVECRGLLAEMPRNWPKRVSERRSGIVWHKTSWHSQEAPSFETSKFQIARLDNVAYWPRVVAETSNIAQRPRYIGLLSVFLVFF